ncbi:MAG: 50S ribosomal protein L4 [Candidatus Paceibacterota bacterium]
MLITTYNQQGEELEEQTRLPKDVFDVEINNDLLHQVVVSQRQNRRQLSADVKDRSEVSGGGRKPWRQKGTGRARHGSIRSPLWEGGGVTFGPDTDRNLKREIPNKMKRKALFMALSSKVEDEELILVDDLSLEEIKTQKAKEILDNLEIDDTCLVALGESNEKVFKSLRNLSKVQVMEARNLNALELLKYKYLVLDKEAIKIIKETFHE